MKALHLLISSKFDPLSLSSLENKTLESLAVVVSGKHSRILCKYFA
jgi:hypothetical protein